MLVLNSVWICPFTDIHLKLTKSNIWLSSVRQYSSMFAQDIYFGTSKNVSTAIHIFSENCIFSLIASDKGSTGYKRNELNLP